MTPKDPKWPKNWNLLNLWKMKNIYPASKKMAMNTILELSMSSNQEVDEMIFFVMLYIISAKFLTGNWLQMISSNSGTCWTPWWTSTSSTRRSSSSSIWNYFFYHVIHHFSLVFDGELIVNNFNYLWFMLNTMVDVNINDKEKFIK